MDEHNQSSFIRISIDSIDTLFYLSNILNDYIFRGQANSDWKLNTSLERTVSDFANFSDLLPMIESTTIADFKRSSKNYITNLPEPAEYVEWLSLMQHYGCPTRLLDFTKSIYVAAFFAADKLSNVSSIWAINSKTLSKRSESILRKHATISAKGISKSDITNATFANSCIVPYGDILAPTSDAKGIINVQPFYMNNRIFIQQGLFLFPCDIKLSFEDNLSSTFGYSINDLCNQSPIEYNKNINLSLSLYDIIKIDINRATQLKILLELNKVNINSSTLFPGLEGYAKSLRNNFLLFNTANWED